MPTIETSIWLALKVRVQALALSPVLPVAWPNEAFTKPAAGYLRVTHIPNLNRRFLIGPSDPHQRLGLLQLDVFKPKNQQVGIVIEQAGLVAAHFPPDLRLTSEGFSVRITKAPDVGQAVNDDPHIFVPVMVSYETFA